MVEVEEEGTERRGEKESTSEDGEDGACIIRSCATKETPSYRLLPCTPETPPHQPDLPTDIRLYLRVVGDARVHDARPTRIACYGM